MMASPSCGCSRHKVFICLQLLSCLYKIASSQLYLITKLEFDMSLFLSKYLDKIPTWQQNNFEELSFALAASRPLFFPQVKS